MPIDPNLRLHPLTHSTIPSYVALRIAAFPRTINRIVFEPGGPNPTTIAAMHDRVRTFVDAGDPCFVVQDESTGEVIAAAKWRLVGKKDAEGKVRHLTSEELDEELVAPPKWLESEERMWQAFYKSLNGMTREVMGTRPYWTLDLLMTDPKHERRGAATMLVQWGCDRADEMGIEAYLTASQTGTPMYQRLGLQTVKKATFDPVKEVGRDVGYVYDYNAMVRTPKKKE